MITITKRVEFDAGHRVAQHNGKCINPHGHRYVVEATITGPVAADGMIQDFAAIAHTLRTITDRFDHAFLIDVADEDMAAAFAGRDWRVVPLPGPPTAEILAAEIGGRLAAAVDNLGVLAVTVRETPTSWATWHP